MRVFDYIVVLLLDTITIYAASGTLLWLILAVILYYYPNCETFLKRFSKSLTTAGCSFDVSQEGDEAVVDISKVTPSADSVRPLNPPIPVKVRESARQLPVAVRIKRRWRRVVSIDDVCNVAEEWWRERPVIRMYYRVNMEDGRRITMFRDMVDGAWYQQNV